MANLMHYALAHGQRNKKGYTIYSVSKDNDHDYDYWFIVCFDDGLMKSVSRILSDNPSYINKYLEDCTDKYMFDIRELSTYRKYEYGKSQMTLSEQYDSMMKHDISIIRKAIRSGELIPTFAFSDNKLNG